MLIFQSRCETALLFGKKVVPLQRNFCGGGVMVAALALGANVERRGGSSPFCRTTPIGTAIGQIKINKPCQNRAIFFTLIFNLTRKLV